MGQGLFILGSDPRDPERRMRTVTQGRKKAIQGCVTGPVTALGNWARSPWKPLKSRIECVSEVLRGGSTEPNPLCPVAYWPRVAL